MTIDYHFFISFVIFLKFCPLSASHPYYYLAVANSTYITPSQWRQDLPALVAKLDIKPT